MLILGIDPGTATTGFGFIRTQKGKTLLESFGLIETDKNGSPGSRFINIEKQMLSLFRKFSPDIMAMERLFFAANVKTAMSVGQAQGVMLLAAAKSKVEVVQIAPGTIKKIIAGNGRADKKAVQRALRKILGAKVRSGPRKKTHFDNAADALAVALCYAYTYSEGGEKIG